MSKVLIIAEAGVNHNGDIEIAKRLIDAAAAAGADIVKFQTFNASLLTAKSAKLADYQKRNLDSNEQSQQEMLKKLELPKDDHYRLIEHAAKKGIRFFSTAFDLESVSFLKSLNLGLWKIPSGEITNLPYLEQIASYGEKIILSTGMCDMSEVTEAVDALLRTGSKKTDLCVLHCNTEYPTPMKDVNLRAMAKMGKDLGVSYGYSDHTLGIEVPIAAVALGASVIEKHFTLDKNMSGPDHKASLEPNELTNMVRSIRNIEKALGSDSKQATPSEIKNRQVVRKSIVAKTPIAKGSLFNDKNLTTKRPGTGTSPMNWHKVLGTAASKDFQEDDIID